jgi:hypothetical protein
MLYQWETPREAPAACRVRGVRVGVRAEHAENGTRAKFFADMLVYSAWRLLRDTNAKRPIEATLY